MARCGEGAPAAAEEEAWCVAVEAGVSGLTRLVPCLAPSCGTAVWAEVVAEGGHSCMVAGVRLMPVGVLYAEWSACHARRRPCSLMASTRHGGRGCGHELTHRRRSGWTLGRRREGEK